jgi:hypothetical protein
MKRKEAVLLALLLAFSCKAERSSMPVAEDVAATQTAAVAQRAGAVPVADTKAQAPAMPRIIIRNAQLTLIVADAAPVVDKLTALANAAGGYVSDSKQWRESEQLRASITLRVPAQRLDQVLTTARQLARRVENENVDANDVTQEYVDLESQVRNLEATETEMRALMTDVRQRMKKAEDILEIYNHLTQLRGQIEQARGRMRYLSQLSALATVKIELVPDAIAKPVVAAGWQPFVVVRDASRSLVATLQALATVGIWLGIYVLPIGLLLALAVWILWRLWRASRRATSAS